MIRLHPDDIKAIAERVVALMGVQPPTVLPQLSIGQQAIMLARQGKVEESKELLRAHSKRRAA